MILCGDNILSPHRILCGDDFLSPHRILCGDKLQKGTQLTKVLETAKSKTRTKKFAMCYFATPHSTEHFCTQCHVDMAQAIRLKLEHRVVHK